MNILIFACVDFPEGPATTSRIRLLSRMLITAGHDVSLAIFNANAKKTIPENSLATGIFESVNFRYLSGSTVRPAGFFGKLFDTLKGIANSTFFLLEKNSSGQADAVIFYTPDIYRSLPPFLLAKLFRIPVILELCEIFSCDKRKSGFLSAIKLIGARISDRILPAMSSGVLAISTRIVDYLKQQGISEKKLMHLPILVDYERFLGSPASPVPGLMGKRYFLNSGALDEKEGIEFILGAFASVSGKHGAVYLAVTGAPENRRKEQVLKLAKVLNIEERIIFLGFLPSSRLLWAYRNAEALICCRADIEFAHYGFPTKLAEYLSSGRPVIANGVGDMPIYLKDGENAFIAVTEDAVSIAGKMETILEDTALASKVGLNGRKVAEACFDYKNYIRPLDKFIESVCRVHKLNRVIEDKD